jgi:three-Cys-motif partner protein
MADHFYGGDHTALKNSIVEQYLKFFTTALKPHFSELWYIDAFAGTGNQTVRHEARDADMLSPAEPERIEQRRGSARIAIDVEPPFDFIVFIDQKQSHVSALNELAAKHPRRRIAVVHSDANNSLRSLLKSNSWSSTRAVLFLDPFGMHVEWSTLELIAQTQAIDVWFLFPLAGLFRQATRRLQDIDEHKRAALTRTFGSADWEQDLYPAEETLDMFGDPQERSRTMDVKGLEAFAKRRLERIFAKVAPPLALPPRRGPQLFSLFLCISNPSPKAIGLSMKVGNHILKGSSS